MNDDDGRTIEAYLVSKQNLLTPLKLVVSSKLVNSSSLSFGTHLSSIEGGIRIGVKSNILSYSKL